VAIDPCAHFDALIDHAKKNQSTFLEVGLEKKICKVRWKGETVLGYNYT